MLSTHNIQTLDQLENKAKDLLDPATYDYIAGGAGNEWGVNNNRNAFLGYHLVPRVAQSNEPADISITLFDKQFPSPLIIGPCAFHKLAHPQGELATARATSKNNSIMTLSTMSTYSIEEVASASNSTKWFQLYVYTNTELTLNLITRAEKCGYTALVVTVDAPMMGLRLRDIHNTFSLPSSIQAANFREIGLANLSDKTAGSSIKDYTDKQFATVTWETIDWLRKHTKLPIILKGILNPDDAFEAINHGVSGLIISNHGGRQLESVVAPIDALPAIAKAVQNRIPLIVDGGIRSGEDILKAIALGAHAVMIARPILWGLAVAGEEGVSVVLDKLQRELVTAMRLVGCQSLKMVHQLGLKLLSGPSLPNRNILELESKLQELEKTVMKMAESATPTPDVRRRSWKF